MENYKNKLAILMATYNGEKYITQQLKSISNQDFQKFDLIIRDDGSTDKTVNKIKRFKEKSNNLNIVLLQNISVKHGQLSNFSFLFDYARKKNYQYIMFSDQDDLWFKDKVKKSLNFILKLKNRPALVYTNYIEWNMFSNKKALAYKYPKKYTFEKLFVQNWMMGCTFILNKALIEKIKFIPDNVDNHDYWIALISSLNNNIYYISSPTMIHRLHSNNVTGKANSKTMISRIKRIYKDFFKDGREKKYVTWLNINNILKEQFGENKHVNNLSKILSMKRLAAVREAKKLGFVGLNNKSTVYFYIFLFLKGKVDIN